MAIMPGYPVRKESAMLETEFEGRTVIEINFTGCLKIGKFRAHNYFGDRSFYILHVPAVSDYTFGESFLFG